MGNIKYSKSLDLFYGSNVTSKDLMIAWNKANRAKAKLGDVEKVTVTASDDNSITLHFETSKFTFDNKIFRNEYDEGVT